MKKLKFHIKTYGCQMNDADSDLMSGMLNRLGMTQSADMAGSDIIIFNTCSVRDNAENRALTNLISLKNLKANKPQSILVFAGCAAQRLKDELPAKAPHLDILLGTRQLYKLPELIKSILEERKTGTLVETDDKHIMEDRCKFIDKNSSKLQSFVPIMRGCNNYCSYCIVPYVRGKEVCRPADSIIEELGILSSNGCKEITLLGQNVNSYKFRDGTKTIYFADLLSEAERIKGIERIRFMTSHPKDVSDRLIDVIHNSSKLCEHFHLPLQSGSDNILKSMKRKYTRESYLNLISRIKTKIPGASITTDIIVGFPDETDKDFEDTLEIIKKVQFDSAYTFKYSPRPGTAAAAAGDSVPVNIKEKRLDKLNKVMGELVLAQNKKFPGRKEKILVEGYNNKNGKLMGKTRTFKMVFFNGNKNLIGKLIDIEITEAHPWSLLGKQLD